MKKIILIMAAAVLALSASAQNLKFAHVNFNELVMLMPEADAASSIWDLEASQKEAQETYQTMIEEYQTKAQKFQQNQATWTAAIKESKQKELTDISNRIQEFDQSIQQELQQQQAQLMAPIQQKAIDAVNNLAKEGGYIYVFEESSLLYIDKAQSTDLTPAARKALNIPDGRTLETLQQELQAKAQMAE